MFVKDSCHSLLMLFAVVDSSCFFCFFFCPKRHVTLAEDQMEGLTAKSAFQFCAVLDARSAPLALYVVGQSQSSLLDKPLLISLVDSDDVCMLVDMCAMQVCAQRRRLRLYPNMYKRQQMQTDVLMPESQCTL